MNSAIDATVAAEAAVQAWRRQAFGSFTSALEDAGIDYCLLGRVDDFPAIIESDIDFVVGQHDLARLPKLVFDVAARCCASVVQCLQHEVGASYFVIAHRIGSRMAYLHPDASGDYRRGGRLWMTAERLLAGRFRHGHGFWVPAPADAFLYYLIKRIDKNILESVHFDYLIRRLAEERESCAAALRERFGDGLARGVLDALASNDCRGLTDRLPELRRRMHATSRQESRAERARVAAGELRRRAGRVVRPTGLVVGFLGPDGAGKSTLIQALTRELAPAFRRTSYFHLRTSVLLRRSESQGGGAVTAPHGQTPRGRLASLVKLFALAAEYVAGYAAVVLPMKIRSSLVIFDRYFHDLQADPLRYRWQGAPWLSRATGRLLPEPDVWIILDAPSAVLLARKAEVSAAAAELQRAGYRALGRQLKHSVVIDTSATVESSVGAALDFVTAHLAARAADRFGQPVRR